MGYRLNLLQNRVERNLLKGKMLNGKTRSDVKIGSNVNIVLKQDQRSGKLTNGIVKNILTNSSFHPRGIKVRLEDGQIGRVQEIIKE